MKTTNEMKVLTASKLPTLKALITTLESARKLADEKGVAAAEAKKNWQNTTDAAAKLIAEAKADDAHAEAAAMVVILAEMEKQDLGLEAAVRLISERGGMFIAESPTGSLSAAVSSKITGKQAWYSVF